MRRKPFDKHASHTCEIRTTNNVHMAGYYCIDCHKWIGWLGYADYIRASDLGLIKEDAFALFEKKANNFDK